MKNILKIFTWKPTLVQVRSKSVSNEGRLTLEAQKVIRPCIPLHCSGVTETLHMAPPAHVLHAVQVRKKSVGNEGHFTLEAERVFRLYLPLQCNGVTEIYNMALPPNMQKAVQVRLKSVSTEGHFTLAAERVFVRISPSIAVASLTNTTQ
jgi:hypothetical protein